MHLARSLLRSISPLLLVGLLLAVILAGCQQPEPPANTEPQPNPENPPKAIPYVAGTWEDADAIVSGCGQSAPLDLLLFLGQAEGSRSLTGDTYLVQPTGDIAQGVFEGKVTETGDVTGSANYGEGATTMSAAMSYTDSLMSGTFEEAEPHECGDGTTDQSTIVFYLRASNATPPEAETPPPPEEPVKDDALEPDDEAEAASPISLDFDADLTLSYGDPDWFAFTLDEESLVSARISVEPPFGFSATAAFYDAAGEFLATVNPLEGILTSFTRLPAGQYYLAIEGRSYAADGSYHLSVKAEAVPDSAFETNDSSETASPLTLDFSGDMFLATDEEDWYTFSLATDQFLTVDLGIQDSSAFSLGLYDSKVEPITSSSLDGYYGSRAETATLLAGTYYLRVYDTDPYSDREHRYPLRISTRDLPDAAFEPNDSLDTASALVPDQPQDMYLTYQDEDWFTFTLTDDQIVTIDMGDAYFGPWYAIYDDNLQVLLEHQYRGEPYVRQLRAGTYHLKVYGFGGTATDGKDYPLELNVQALPDAAYEPNESFNDAAPLTLPIDGSFYLGAEDDEWFSFTLAQDSLLTIGFAKDDYGGLRGSLYTPDGDYLTGFTVDRTESLAYMVLGAGTYFLQLENDRVAAGFAFGFSMSAQAIPDTEHEPNNDRANATPIDLGFRDDALVVSAADPDWFTFTLADATQITVTLASALEPYSLDATLKESDGTGLMSLPLGDTSPVLPAGTYYLRFAPKYFIVPEAVAFGLSIARK